jgi:collagen type I/II/III/V/XI/XXIV/XXVII alpha
MPSLPLIGDARRASRPAGPTSTVSDPLGLPIGDPSQGVADATSEATRTSEPSVACFVAGTWITTTRGYVTVECVRPGDRVCTVLRGSDAEVIWVGRRTVNCTRHPVPTKVWPVQVARDAFGRGIPAADLYLSPNHAIFVDRVLIPIRLLVNGRSVRQVMRERVSYHHIELAQHDVLQANGMAAESYLDTGDRARFSNGGDVITLHPDLSAPTPEILGCARLVQDGPVLDAVRNRLAAGGARRKRGTREIFAPGTTWPG